MSDGPFLYEHLFTKESGDLNSKILKIIKRIISESTSIIDLLDGLAEASGISFSEPFSDNARIEEIASEVFPLINTHNSKRKPHAKENRRSLVINAFVNSRESHLDKLRELFNGIEKEPTMAIYGFGNPFAELLCFSADDFFDSDIQKLFDNAKILIRFMGIEKFTNKQNQLDNKMEPIEYMPLWSDEALSDEKIGRDMLNIQEGIANKKTFASHAKKFREKYPHVFLPITDRRGVQFKYDENRINEALIEYGCKPYLNF